MGKNGEKQGRFPFINENVSFWEREKENSLFFCFWAVLGGTGYSALRGGLLLKASKVIKNACGPPTFGWLRSRRKKIECFATGLRYAAIGRGICLKSELFKLRQAARRRQRMLRNNRGAFFHLRLQAAFRRVRESNAL